MAKKNLGLPLGGPEIAQLQINCQPAFELAIVKKN